MKQSFLIADLWGSLDETNTIMLVLKELYNDTFLEFEAAFKKCKYGLPDTHEFHRLFDRRCDERYYDIEVWEKFNTMKNKRRHKFVFDKVKKVVRNNYTMGCDFNRKHYNYSATNFACIMLDLMNATHTTDDAYQIAKDNEQEFDIFVRNYYKMTTSIGFEEKTNWRDKEWHNLMDKYGALALYNPEDYSYSGRMSKDSGVLRLFAHTKEGVG